MGKPSESDAGEMTAEFEGDSLGDARLDERLRRIVSLAAPDPGDSFPEQMASVAPPGRRCIGSSRIRRSRWRACSVGTFDRPMTGCVVTRSFGSCMTPVRFGFSETASAWVSSAGAPRAFSDMSRWRWPRTTRGNR